MIDLNPQTLFHIAAGSAAILSGAVAMVARKGGPTHKRAGQVFTLSMLAMCASGVLLAVLIDERFTVLIGLFSIYLVCTSWLAAHRPAGVRDWRDGALMSAGLGIAGGYAFLGLNPPNDYFPAGAYFFMAALVTFAAAWDLRLVLGQTLGAGARLARHLWRMCTALAIASASVFIGQQDEFPAMFKWGWVWMAPTLATLAAMVFWLVKVQRRPRRAA
jgi:uncharacterized membrane protein